MKFPNLKVVVLILLMLPAVGCRQMKTISRHVDNGRMISKVPQQLGLSSKIMIPSNIIAKNMPDTANPQNRIVTLNKTREVITVSCKTNEVIGKTKKVVEAILRKETSKISQEEQLYQLFIQLTCQLNDSVN